MVTQKANDRRFQPLSFPGLRLYVLVLRCGDVLRKGEGQGLEGLLSPY